MPQYRKKPVVIDAVHYDEMAARTGFRHDVFVAHPWLEAAYENDVISNCATSSASGPVDRHIKIKTLEGNMRADPGDWIIRGVKGEIYPCKPHIFEATYEPA